MDACINSFFTFFVILFNSICSTFLNLKNQKLVWIKVIIWIWLSNLEIKEELNFALISFLCFFSCFNYEFAILKIFLFLLFFSFLKRFFVLTSTTSPLRSLGGAGSNVLINLSKVIVTDMTMLIISSRLRWNHGLEDWLVDLLWQSSIISSRIGIIANWKMKQKSFLFQQCS